MRNKHNPHAQPSTWYEQYEQQVKDNAQFWRWWRLQHPRYEKQPRPCLSLQGRQVDAQLWDISDGKGRDEAKFFLPCQQPTTNLKEDN